MKLVVIYGPIGTGKFTVAKRLAKITSYKLFHNHMVVDMLLPFMKFGPNFWDAANDIRIRVFEAAAKEKIKGMVFTFVYAKGIDEKFIRRIINNVKRNKGKIHFVRLYCDLKTLNKRVESAQRGKFRKLRSAKRLKKVMKKWDIVSPIPFVKSLEIDNTKLSADKTARMIKNHFKL